MNCQNKKINTNPCLCYKLTSIQEFLFLNLNFLILYCKNVRKLKKTFYIHYVFRPLCVPFLLFYCIMQKKNYLAGFLVRLGGFLIKTNVCLFCHTKLETKQIDTKTDGQANCIFYI